MGVEGDGESKRGNWDWDLGAKRVAGRGLTVVASSTLCDIKTCFCRSLHFDADTRFVLPLMPRKVV